MADVSAILSKLYSGSPLSAQEKFDIGIGPAPTPEVATSNWSIANARAGEQASIDKLGENYVPPTSTAEQEAALKDAALGIDRAAGTITDDKTGNVYSLSSASGQNALKYNTQNYEDVANINPPYDAPEGNHWDWDPYNRKWTLYKDFTNAPAGGTGGTGGTTGTTGATTGTTGTPTQSAKDYISKFLNDAGLGNLAGQVWTQWTSGQSEDQIVDWIRSTPEYASRFPAMATLRKDGRSITEAQYVAKEQADIDLMKQYGIPDAMAMDKKLLGNLIANNVSQVTLQKRLIAGQDTVLGFDKQIRQYAKDTYGLGDGALLGWVLNPDVALPVLEQQAQAMRIGGAALTAGYSRGLGTEGELAKTQAEALATQGITQQQAQQGFAQLSQMGQLEQALPGDTSGQLSSQEMIDAIFGVSGAAQAKYGKVKALRVGEFQQGGGFAGTQQGISGIGQAPQV